MQRWYCLGGAMALLVLALSGPESRAGVLAPPYDSAYTITDLGVPDGVPGPLGGLVLLASDPNVLLVGGNANNADGAIYAIGLTRDANNHITGFSGPATLYATAPFIDGGLMYGPGGVLFYTRYPSNEIGQIKPGSTTTDKVVDMTALGVAFSLGALNFAPDGSLKMNSWSGGEYYTTTVSPDGTGTYDIATPTFVTTLPGGPEGFVYVPTGSPLFPGPAMLVSEYSAGKIAAYDIDANYDPILASRRDFVTELFGAEGAFVDPLTGDFLFSTFGGGDHVEIVRGFAAPTAVPEPGSLALLGVGAASLLGYGWRRKTAAGAK